MLVWAFYDTKDPVYTMIIPCESDLHIDNDFCRNRRNARTQNIVQVSILVVIIICKAYCTHVAGWISVMVFLRQTGAALELHVGFIPIFAPEAIPVRIA